MKDSRNAFRITAAIKGALFFLLLFCIPYLSHAGSIRDVVQSVGKVKSIEPPFQFAVIGDSRDGKKVYTRLLQKILDRKPHFILHLGDMISKASEKEWKEFFEVSKTVEIPFFPVIGNHEVARSVRGEEIYQKQFILPDEKTYYAFKAGGAFFVVLDSEKGKGKIIDQQWFWLRDILSSSDEPLKMIFIHRPLFLPMGSLKLGKGLDKYPLARDDLHRLFVRTKVKAVFQADDHRYDRMERDHVLYIITGGGGAPIYAFKDSGGFFHYLWLSIQDGRMDGEVVDLEGQVQDRFMIAWPTSLGSDSGFPAQAETQK
jgi:hypothetical protein